MDAKSLGAHCQRIFSYLRVGLPEYWGSPRSLEVKLDVVHSKSLTAKIEERKGSILITVSSHWLEGVYENISSNKEHILLTLLGNQDEIDSDPEAVLSMVYDLVISFVLIHELAHVYLGHSTHYFSISRGVFDESHFGFGESVLSMSEEECFYVEMEADSAALTILVDGYRHEGLMEIAHEFGPVDPGVRNVNGLIGAARDFSIRTVACAAWIAIAQLEVSRADSPQHPSPTARILSLISTAMALYSNADNLVPDDNGAQIHNLNEEESVSMKCFLDTVLKPVVVNLWMYPNEEASRRLGMEDKESPGQLLRDFLCLVRNDEPETDATIQLARIEAHRNRMIAELLPYRNIALPITQ